LYARSLSRQKMKRQTIQLKPKYLLPSLVIPLLAGFVGSLFTVQNIPTWYALLNKPFFNPPNAIFGPTWTTLYLLMGFALYLVIQTETEKRKILAYKFFALQLFLNTLWSILFFGLHAVGLAFIEIVVLWTAIFKNIIEFGKINKLASYLLIPYIAWVTFAAVLNFAILLLN